MENSENEVLYSHTSVQLTELSTEQSLYTLSGAFFRYKTLFANGFFPNFLPSRFLALLEPFSGSLFAAEPVD